MPLDPRHALALVRSALDLAEPAARRAFLDRESGGDAALRRRVDDLLRAAEAPDSLLEGLVATDSGEADFALGSALPGADGATIGLDAGGATVAGGSAVPDGATVGLNDVGAGPGSASAPTSPADAAVALVAGRYRLGRVIGEGGMGTVYLAEQVRPVKRQVALKLVRAGMDSRQVLARFDSERQALALMDHPHIARVLDAGATDSGHPFFVMELVRGVPLTEYCDAHRLDLPRRLDLFRQICAAVQHAHQKGIIHRDLKPTNILVEDHDGTPVPKVIDFGLAKATSGQNLTEQSVFTAFGMIAGTPLYMAPEQAALDAHDVDTRADIYALGVILYELLTGSTPIRRESLHKAALSEVLRVVREEEPPVPSHRIGSSDALPSVAANRHIEPGRLGRFVRGDLDWVVMKALAKERARRYDSAIGLANDVERFLNHEPVSAGPPTARYRTAKFIRRHRGQVVAAALVVLTLVGGVVGTTLGLIEARDQRGRAIAQKGEADRQRGIAVAEAAEREEARQAEAEQRRRSEGRLMQVAKMNEILGSIFGDLDLQGAEAEGKPLVAALGERLDQATAALAGESIGDPLAVARMQHTLGRSQTSLGYPRKAIDLLERSAATLAGEFRADHPEVLAVKQALAQAHEVDGRFDRAIPLFEQILAARRIQPGPDHPDTLKAMNDLGEAYIQADRLDEAVSLLERTLEARRARLGPDDPETLRSMNNLGNAYLTAGRVDRAVPLLERAWPAREARIGPDHPDTLATLNNLATAYLEAHRLDEAVPLFERALAATRAKLGPDHPRTLNAMDNLGYAYREAGQPRRALPLIEEALGRRRVKLGPDHPDTLTGLMMLAEVHDSLGQVAQSKDIDRQYLEATQQRYGPDAPELAIAQANVATKLLRWEDWGGAEPILRACLAIRERRSPDDWRTDNTRSLLGGALLGLHRPDDARPLLVAGFEGMDRQRDKIPGRAADRLVAAADRLIRLAEATNRPDEATAWRAAKARIEAQARPPASAGATPPPPSGTNPAPPPGARPAPPTAEPQPTPMPAPRS